MPRHLPCVRPINTLAIVICNHYHCPCFVRIDSIRFSRSPRARWPAALPGVSPVRREEVYYASPSTVSTADFEELSGSPRGPPRCAAPRGAGCILYANQGAGARGDPEVFKEGPEGVGAGAGRPQCPRGVWGGTGSLPYGFGARRRWRGGRAVSNSGGADSVWRLRGTAGRPAAAQDGRAAARGMGRDRVPPLRRFGPRAAGAAGQLSAARVARRFSECPIVQTIARLRRIGLKRRLPERSVVQRIARLRHIGLKRRLPERLVVQAIRTMRFRERWQSPPSTKTARKREGAKAQAPAPCFACLYQLRA